MKKCSAVLLILVMLLGMITGNVGRFETIAYAISGPMEGLTITGDPESAQGATWKYQGQKDGVTYNINGILFKPKGVGSFPGIIISHGKGGSAAAYSRGIAKEMVQWGLVAIGVNYTHAVEPQGEGAPGTAEEKYQGASVENVLRGAMCIDILNSLGYVDMNRLAAHGHSMGAFVTAALVGSYPSQFLVASHTAGGTAGNDDAVLFSTKLAQVQGIKTPYQIHHGTADVVVNISLDRNLKKLLTNSGVECEMIEYDGWDHKQVSTSAEMLNQVHKWYSDHGLFDPSGIEITPAPVSSPSTTPAALPIPATDAIFTSGVTNGKSYLSAAYTTRSGVGYGMDVYRPEGQGPFPVILAVHGGGWQNGSRKEMPKALTFINQGFAVAVIDYRLTDVAPFPAQLQDCKAAVRFLRAHANDLNIDPLRIGAFGGSAGGHLVSMLGMTNGLTGYTVGSETVDFIGEDKSNLEYSDYVSAVTDYYGPADLLAMASAGNHGQPDSPESKLVGGTLSEVPDKCAVASPITYVKQYMPPFLIVHGTVDNTVPYSQSVALCDKLKTFGNDVELKLIEGKGHGNFEPATDVFMYDFFKKQLSNPIAKKQIKLIVGQPFAYLDNVLTEIDPLLKTKAILADDRVFLPVRFIAEAYDAKVSWDEVTQTVTVEKGADTVRFQIGAPVMEVNGQTLDIDAPAHLENDRTLLPVRALSEALRLEVLWDEATNTVILNRNDDL